MLDKTYEPKSIEGRLYKAWEDSGAFKPSRPEGKPFTIVIPPPNVTGSLHMGHALNNTIQDILARYQRMLGCDVLWQPGTDHAGIATQMVVERQLAAEGSNVTRREMGREKFIERIWKWKAESGGTIVNQLRRLGASCDWSRERFTLDDGLSAAVRRVFVTLYKEKLIYRDKRLVNWDPALLTAISDLEVEQRETKGHLWHFKYPIEGEDDRFIVVATTRPETMLGDTGVAVNPEDERYKDLIGKHVVLPLVGRRIPIVGDEHADPEQGSGAVKITPAHDFNDFEVGRRHSLDVINIFDETAHLNDAVPEAYRGLERFEARKRVVADLEALGLLDKIEDHVHVVPHGDRSGMVIEPYLTDQWYVDAATLAKPAIAAVETGETTFVPAHWDKTYYEWMRNIQPWCISRQLWWGHRIPAWYAPDGTVFVAEDEAAAKTAARENLGKDVELRQDEDVLDTWFSSALWPFSTLGWPEETPELKRHYKTDVLVTAFDIIFFWVARMMMMGLHFMKEVPFHTVYIHALVRDEKGQKMSKSKGNVVDPLELMDAYGADALRFTLAALAVPGRDVRMSEKRVEGYRNFATKLWNASRFAEMNQCRSVPGFIPASAKETVNRWIVGEVRKAAAKVSQGIEEYRFNDAADAIYHFVWGTYCDWYLEFIKPLLTSSNETALAETRATAGWALDQILALLHPFMPFITEELWDRLSDSRTSMLIVGDWPEADAKGFDAEAEAEMAWAIQAISDIRGVRSEMNVPPGAKIPVLVQGASAASQKRIDRHGDLIKRLARLNSIAVLDGAVPAGSVQAVIGEATFVLPLAGVIDIRAELTRLEKELSKHQKDIAGLDAKLSNEKFIANAPDHIVEEQRERRAEATATVEKLNAAVKRLSAMG
jgi:valyl-tRNA synthetase